MAEQESEKRTIWHWLSWGFGLLFLLGGLTSLGQGHGIFALGALGVAALLLPPVRARAYQKTGYSLPVWGRAVAVVALAVVMSPFTPPPNETARQPQGQAVEKAAPTLPRHQLELEEIVRDEFGSTLISVEVRKSPVGIEVDEGALGIKIEGGPILDAWIVDVAFEASQGLTTYYTKLGVEHAMMDGYEAIFTSPVPVTFAQIEVHYQLRDRFGNESLGLVYKTRMDREVAARVNWENKREIDASRIWVTNFLHQAFRQD